MQQQTLRQLIINTRAIISDAISPKVEEVIQSGIFKNVSGLALLNFAIRQQPNPITSASIKFAYPYTNTTYLQNLIEQLKKAELLDIHGVITDEAIDAYQELEKKENQYISELLPENDSIEKAMTYLQTILDMAVTLEDPSPKILTAGFNRDIGDTNLQRLFHYIGYLNAFRDDAHISAWRKYGLDGRTLDALTILWSGKETANTLNEITTIRQHHGWSVDDWETSLHILLENEWATKTGSAYVISDAGKRVRDDIEMQTDEYFFTAFKPLSDADMLIFANSLTEIRTGMSA